MTEEDKLYADELKNRALADYERLDLAINELERQTCDSPRNNLTESSQDCISRQAVLNMKRLFIDEDGVMAYAVPTGNILRLPSVQSTRPTGKWIEKEDYNLDTYYECSECGADYCIEGDILIHKYCPNCGAKMTESEGEE